MEKGYFEGQVDALSGDVRIVRVYSDDSIPKWDWAKSPWDSGRAPVYTPSK